ncbi:uncharacterized protein LOC110850968 isoform X4 [Folsomia candida]|uniref:uncharacterized protein LOC110850968 isoform X4 n=1 Tax=Folsomia candida TaxID=158441 RepID=UPI00160525B8|nr:uncharacterized protein LOC110850968 isoform X4 [Folsomia candida]
MLELTALKRSHQSARASSSRHSSLGQSPPDSPLCSTPDSVLSRGESTTALSQLSTPVVPSLDEQQQHTLYQSSGTYSRGVSHHSLPRTYKSSSFSPLRHGRKRLRRSTSVTDLTQGGGGVLLQQPGGVNPNVQKPRATLLSQKSLQFDDPIASNHQIERIIFKIQQDNKILAELDKNAVCGSRFSTHPHPPKGHMPAPHRRILPKKPTSSKYHVPKITIDHIDEPEISGSTSRDLSGIYDHHHSGMHPQGTSSTMQTLHGMGGMPQFQPIATVLPTNFFSVVPAGTVFHSQGPTTTLQQTANQQQQHQHHLQHSSGMMHHHSMQPQSITIPTIITTAHVDSKTGGMGVSHHQQQILNGTKQQQQQHQQHQHQMQIQHQLQHQATKGAEMLDVPGKGRCFVYSVRYSYDPFHQSPNENPEAELSLNAGDYVLVWGTMDEDGFLDGELLDGRRGLVPSNYVERLVGDDLLEFHQQVVLGIKDSEDCFSTSLLDFEYARDVADEESQRLIIAKNKNRIQRTLPPLMLNQEEAFRRQEELMHRRQEEFGYLDLEDLIDDDGDPEKQVPPPIHLVLQRQLNKSILIGWNSPDCPPGTIDTYQVFVNGLLRCTIKANERTRALVEGVDCNRPHRISVRAVTPNRRTSRDAACTMVIGKDAPLSPSCIRATSVTSTSSVISWLPANSNYQHVVCVNNVEVRTVKPGIYRHTITGLTPNTTYRVTVRSKNIKAPHFDEKGSKQMEKLSAHTEFKTLPKGCVGCLPDPPIDVQVEPGPQDNTILVTWHPVAAATSNGAIVTGYAVFADGRKILEIDSPSGDHALLDLNRFQGMIPRQVTVRTKSRDILSSDSVPIPIPAQVLRLKRHNIPQQNNLPPRRGAGGARHPSMMEGEESFSDREVAGFHMPIPSIGSLNIKNRLKNSFNLMRTNEIPPEIPKDTDRHGRPLNPNQRVDYGIRGPPPPGPSDPRGRGPGGGPMSSDRPRGGGGGYLPQQQHPQQPPHMRQDPRSTQPPQDYYSRRPPRPGPRPPADVRHRLFVALFDYDPPTMSPNPDACEEELPFREGQLIKIYGEKDPDGFYWGEAGGRRGFVPCNMVSEVQPDDERVAQELLNQESGEPLASGRERRAMGRDRWGDIYASVPVKIMVALYDYDPQELSPNVDSEVELSFQTGDIIKVFGEMDDDGFFMGELNGVRGLVPSNFLAEAPPEYGGDGRGGRQLQQQRGGPPPPHGPQDHRRPSGPGPGARGPPPPPREAQMMGQGRGGPRKDASYPHSERNNFDGVARRGGRGGGGSSTGPPAGLGRGGGAQGPQNQQQQLLQRNARGGLPEFSPTMMEPSGSYSTGGGKVTATTVMTSNAGATGAGTSANPITSKLPGVLTDAPGSLMQKFSDFTHSAIGGGSGEGGASEGSILSKGKDLIFKRFGL